MDPVMIDRLVVPKAQGFWRSSDFSENSGKGEGLQGFGVII